MPPDRVAISPHHLQRERIPPRDPTKLPSPQDPDTAILYLLPRFPVLSQTFVLTEWSRMRRFFRTELASLFTEKTHVIHPLSAEVAPRVHLVPLIGAQTLLDNLTLLRRRPRLYVRTFLRVVAASYRRPAGGSLKGVLVFVKAAALAGLVERLGVRHVHAHFIHHPATAAWAIHRLTGVSFSVTAHADDLFIGPALLREKVSESAFVATISEYNRAFLERHVRGVGRIEVVHCGVDPEALPYREREGHRRVVCVARLEAKKGHRDLLRAIALARADVPGLSLDLVGEGIEYDALRRLCDELGLRNEVRFHGALSSDEVRALLYASDLFVLAAVQTQVTSFRTGYLDGIPVSLMEAMATGLPVVATSVSGIPELVVDGQTGLLAGAGDVHALAKAIVRLCNEPELGPRLARNARSLVVERFNLDVESERLARLLESTVPRAHAIDTPSHLGDERSRRPGLASPGP
jgi:glycosyltransferase involved in cell wall biosynthesis